MIDTLTVIASVTKQSSILRHSYFLDCFVAMLLAMTKPTTLLLFNHNFLNLSYNKKTPVTFSGVNGLFWGLNGINTAAGMIYWGSRISVEYTPSSLLRLIKPLYRAIILSIRTRPNPCPAPLVDRNSPLIFCFFPGGAKLVKDI